MEESEKFCASRHDVARTGELVLMLPALKSTPTPKRDVAAAGAPGIVLDDVDHRLGGIW